MQYQYVAVYKLIGVTRPADGKEQELVEYPAIDAKSLITYDIDGHLLELDKASVIGFLILKGIFGKPSIGTFEERLAHELEEKKRKREKDVGQGVFVVFKAKGEIETFEPSNMREMPDFIIAFHGAPKQPIRSKYQAPINGLLASFALGSNDMYGVKKITDDVIFFNKDGKPVYSYTFGMNGKAILSTVLKNDSFTFVINNAKALGKHQLLVDSARLLSRSLDEDSDDLQTFLSVWAGLEIFIRKNFKEYEDVTFEKLSAGIAVSASSKLLGHIKNIMKDKYRLTGKFSLVSFVLAPEAAEEDIKRFVDIKEVRDKLMHGHDIEISSLPTEDTRKLLRKYLKLHVQRIRA